VKKKKNNRTLLLIIIMLMLLVVCLAAVWIIHRGRVNNEVRRQEAAEQAAEEEAQTKAEEEAAAKQQTEDSAVASHVYSNRGKAGEEEHSFKAYDAAIEAGSQYIGVDVVMSSDGVLYVSSELNAVVMTDYNGMYEYISSETVDTLKTAAGNKILRLSEVFDKYGDSVNYVIELKPESEACADAFIKMVDEYGLSEKITAGSMYSAILDRIDSKYPDMPKIYICWNQADFDYVVDKPFIDIVSVKEEAGLMTESNCKAAHDNDKLFSAWTLDSEDTIKRAIDMGVDTYFTNDTPLALSIEREYGLNEGKRKE